MWIPGKVVEEWKGPLVDFIYGNGEDGVLGNSLWRAKFKSERWCAYVWSALRNPTNNLRFLFRWRKGPFQRWTFKLPAIGLKPLRFYFVSCYIQIGWYSNGYPIFSTGTVGPELPDEKNHGVL